MLPVEMEMNREAMPLAKPDLVVSLAEPPEEHQADFPLWPAKEKEWHPWLARMLGLGSLPYNLGFTAVGSSLLPVLVAIFLLSADMDLDVLTYRKLSGSGTLKPLFARVKKTG